MDDDAHGLHGYSGPDELRKALRRLKPGARTTVACRAALRSLPVLSDTPTAEFGATRRRLFLTALRACIAAIEYSRTGVAPSDLGYILRDLVAVEKEFDSACVVLTCDAIQAMIDSIGDKSAFGELDAILNAAKAADDYAPTKILRRSLLNLAEADIRTLLLHDADVSRLLTSPLWGRTRIPSWNASIWRVASFQLMAAKENWEPWISWYDTVLAGDASGTAALSDAIEAADLTQHDWASPSFANAKIAKAINGDQKVKWSQALDDSQDQDAPPVSVADGRLQFSAEIKSSDAAVAAGPGMDAEYANVRAQVRAAKKLVALWVDKDCHPDWHGLKRDINRLDRLMPADMRVAVGQIAVLWGVGVAVAEYLDQDRQLRANPNSGNAPFLPANIRSSLNTFVQIFAAWLFEFPTAAKREENASAFTGAIDRLNAAKRVVGHIRSADALKREDLLLLEQLLRSAEKDGLQASKAKFWSIATVRRLIFATGRILATGAVGGLAANYADSSQLFERLTKLMLQGEAAVTDFIQDLPSASREALLAVIESLKDAG